MCLFLQPLKDVNIVDVVDNVAWSGNAGMNMRCFLEASSTFVADDRDSRLASQYYRGFSRAKSV